MGWDARAQQWHGFDALHEARGVAGDEGWAEGGDELLQHQQVAPLLGQRQRRRPRRPAAGTGRHAIPPELSDDVRK